MRIVVMGVSGCGKSSLGAALGHRLQVPFHEGDGLHPPANVEKMRNGTPLTDEDRWPWLDRVAVRLGADEAAIVSCSALRRRYRDHIRSRAGAPVRFIHLFGSRELLAQRMQARTSHYMPLSLLESQLATVEPPDAEEALTLDIALPLDRLLEAAVRYLGETKP